MIWLKYVRTYMPFSQIKWVLNHQFKYLVKTFKITNGWCVNGANFHCCLYDCLQMCSPSAVLFSFLLIQKYKIASTTKLLFCQSARWSLYCVYTLLPYHFELQKVQKSNVLLIVKGRFPVIQYTKMCAHNFFCFFLFFFFIQNEAI